MFASNSYETAISKRCGHVQRERLRYQGPKMLLSMKEAYGHYLCDGCRAELKKWWDEAPTCDLNALPFDLPALTGTVNMVRWAQSLRNRHAMRLAGLCSILSEKESSLAVAGVAAIKTFLTIPDSRFWIDNRDVDYDVSRWITETGYALRAPLRAEPLANNSPFLWLRSRKK